MMIYCSIKAEVIPVQSGGQPQKREAATNRFGALCMLYFAADGYNFQGTNSCSPTHLALTRLAY